MIFWDMYKRCYLARLEMSKEELEFIIDLIPYGDTAKEGYVYLLNELQRRNRERDDFND